MVNPDAILGFMTVIACCAGAFGYFKGVQHGRDEALKELTHPIRRERRRRIR